MASDITLSAGVRQNLLSLQNTADLMAMTQNRLATGKKINTALDNPTNFFTSQSLSDRANDLSALLDAINQATKTLDAANNGITSLTKLVQSAQATARQALQAPSAFTNLASISATAGGLATSDLTALIAGTGTNATSGTGSTVIDTTTVPDKVATFAMNAMVADTSAAVTGSAIAAAGGSSNTALSALSIAAGDAITLTGALGTATLNITPATTGANDATNIQASDTIANMVSKLTVLFKQVTGDSGAAVSFNAGTNKFAFAMSDNTQDFTVGGNTAKLGVTAGTYKPTNQSLLGTSATEVGGVVGLQAGGNAIGASLISAITTASKPAATDTITITGAAGTQTITYVANGAPAVVDPTHRTIGLDQDLNTLAATIQDAVRDATGDANAKVDFNVTNANAMTIKLADTTKSFTVGGTGTGATGVGLTAATYDNNPATLANRTAGLQNLVANNLSFNIAVGSNSAKTLYFGTGTGQIQNRRDLIAQLNVITGLSVSSSADNTSTATLTLANSNGSDLKSSMAVNSANSSVISFLGLSNAAANTTNGAETVVNGTNATISATNLLTQVANLAGKTLSVGVGSSSSTFTFGNGINQISTFAELTSAIASLGGILAKDAGNKLSITTSAAHLKEQLNIQGGAASVLGINTGTFSGTGQSLSGTTLTVQSGSGDTLKSSTFTFGTGSNQIKTLDQLNAQLTADSVGVQAKIDADGKLIFTTTNDAASKTFTVSGTAAVVGFGAASAFNLLNSSTPQVGGAGDAQRRTLVSDFNNVISQIDSLAGDASFNGINLLGGDDLQVIFNENNTSKLTIKGVNFDAAGLGLSSLAGDGSDFLDSGSINAILARLDGATRTLRSQASKFGSNLTTVQTRQDFTKNMINTLQTGSDSLVLADTNEEGANMLALQTRQQLSTTALSLANQANQAVLRLFG